MADKQGKPAPPPPAEAIAKPGSRLEELLAAYDVEKANAAEATARFEAVTKALKTELSEAFPGRKDIVASGAPNLPKLRLAWRTPWRFNDKRFKEEQPVLYVKYSEQGGHWELRAQT